MNLQLLKETPPWTWPEDADQILLDSLTSDQVNNDERIIAAELAGDFVVINDDIAKVLLSTLDCSDESEELRSQAATSLGPVLDHTDIEGFEDSDDILISESTFSKIQTALQKLYMDASVPKMVRRRILEASVRAPREWHQDAIRAAYKSDDDDWKLTAVFSMRWVRGFDDEILDALNDSNQDMQYQAISAAGTWEVEAAWSHISSLISSEETDKNLLLAAIEAVVEIRPEEAGTLLVELTDSKDEDIVVAAHEAIAMAEAMESQDDDEYEYDEEEED